MARLPYDAAPTVNPSGVPNDYQTEQASPGAFGGQVAQAAERFGDTAQQAGNTIFDVAQRQQGLLNEAAATNGDTVHAVTVDKIASQFRTNEGFAGAIGSKAYNDSVAAVTKSTADIAATMPNDAARRSFTMLALRNQTRALGEINDHASQQANVAARQSSDASMNNATNQMGSYSVASNENQVRDTLQTIEFQAAHKLQLAGYTDGVTQDPTTGKLSFDSSERGQSAQAVFQSILNEKKGDAYFNAVHILADDPSIGADGLPRGSVAKATAFYQSHYDDIPPEARSKLAAYLQPKIRAADVNTTVSSGLSDAERIYQSKFTGGPQKIDDAIIGQESGGNKGAPTSVNGAVGIGQMTPGTFAQFAKPGEDINNPADNETVSRRAIQSYNQKYNGDSARVAVAYFSGPGNVAPAGSATPWLHNSADGNGKTVSSYVSDIQGRVQGNTGGPQVPTYQSRAGFYNENYEPIINSAVDAYQKAHPDDAVGPDLVRAKMEAHVNDVIRQEAHEDRGDMDMLISASHGGNGAPPPTTIDQMLAQGGPQVRDAYERQSFRNSDAMDKFETHLMTYNSRQQSMGYGDGFYSLYQKVQAGQITDASKLFGNVHNGEDGISPAGLKVLKSAIDRRSSPQGTAEASAEQNFFRTAHAQLTFSNPSQGIYDAKGEKKFTEFMQKALPAIQAGVSGGKSYGTLFDPKSSDYVGKEMSGFMRNPNERMNDYMNASSALNSGQVSADTIKSPDDLKSAVNAGKMTRAMGEEIARSRKWIRDSNAAPASASQPPPVPRDF